MENEIHKPIINLERFNAFILFTHEDVEKFITFITNYFYDIHIITAETNLKCSRYSILFYDDEIPDNYKYKFSKIIKITNKLKIDNVALFLPQPLPLLKKSVIVFDYDETLVDHGVPLDGSLESLNTLRHLFDYIILWTHGTTEYIKSEFVSKFNPFDLILSRDFEYQGPKYQSLLYNSLRQEFNITELGYTCLIDNLHENYANDYDLFIHVHKFPKMTYAEYVDEIIKVIKIDIKEKKISH